MNKYETAVYINLQNNRCGVWKEKTEIRVKTDHVNTQIIQLKQTI